MFTLRLLKLKIHSRRVVVFKRALPAFAFLLASVMIAWPAFNEQKDKFTLATKEATDVQTGNSDMTAVRYFSKDSEENPLTITSQTVRELDKTRKIIALTRPTAKYVMSDGVILTGETSYGLIFQNDKYLYFENRVDGATDTGYQAISEKIVCDYNAGTLASEQDVYIKGPAGMLQANGFYIKENGNYLFFKGYTATLLFQSEKPKEAVSALDFEKQKSYLKEDKGNVYITSENGLIINQVARTITAQKNVDVYQNDGHLESDNLILHYERDGQGKTSVRKVSAQGNVIAKTPAQTATGEVMTVYRAPAEMAQVLQTVPMASVPAQTAQNLSQVITLESSKNNATVSEKKNTIKAQKLIAVYANEISGETAPNKSALSDKSALSAISSASDKSGISGSSNLIKAVALGKASAVSGGQTATGDEIVIYRDKAEIENILKSLPSDKEFQVSETPGQVIVLTGKAVIKEGANTVEADKIYALYNKAGTEMIKAITLGNTSATNGAQRVYGVNGVYTPKTKIVSVYEKVSLHEKESVLQGEYATLNLKTGISSLHASKKGKKAGRVKGQIIPNDFETKKE